MINLGFIIKILFYIPNQPMKFQTIQINLIDFLTNHISFT